MIRPPARRWLRRCRRITAMPKAPDRPGDRDAALMAQALELARQAAGEDEVPVGALVVDDRGQVIGRGYNRREQDHSPIAHAEMLAIAEAARALGSWRLVGCELVVTLEPCPMCLAACQ